MWIFTVNCVLLNFGFDFWTKLKIFYNLKFSFYKIIEFEFFFLIKSLNLLKELKHTYTIYEISLLNLTPFFVLFWKWIFTLIKWNWWKFAEIYSRRVFRFQDLSSIYVFNFEKFKMSLKWSLFGLTSLIRSILDSD